MKALVEQGGTAGVCLEEPSTSGYDEAAAELGLEKIAVQISREPSLCADAVRAALSELMPQPRDPESIEDSESLFLDLGLNSLEYLELWTSIESRLGCRFDDEDLLGDIRTVGDVVRRTLDVYCGGVPA
ncbi:MAG TPA: acyl carrier protein [Longimicrobium sp.]|nr:acyl carrier protein [Longimicrobium sp.]